MEKFTVNCSEPKFMAMLDEYETQNDTTVFVSNVVEKFNPMRVEFNCEHKEFVNFMQSTWNK